MDGKLKDGSGNATHDILLKKIDDHSIWLSIFPEDSPDKPPSRD